MMNAHTTLGRRVLGSRFGWLALLIALMVPLSLELLPGGNKVLAQSNDKITEGTLLARGPDGGALGACPLAHTWVKAEISGFMSRVYLTQEFQNPYTEKIEAVYLFPLPENAAVDDMRIQVGEHVVVGKIMRKPEARATYEAAKANGQVAALLDQERPDVFTQSVANIMPGEKITVQLSYVQTLKYEDGAYEFMFPMVVRQPSNPVTTGGAETASAADRSSSETQEGDSPRQTSPGDSGPAVVTPPVLPPGMRTGRDVEIELDIDAGVPINDFQAKTHEVEIQRQDANRAVVRLKDGPAVPNKDFVFRYDVAGQKVSDAILSHRDKRGGYFTLILQPPDRAPAADITPKELVFVVDTSGSMYGFPLETAKQSIYYAMDNLNPSDTFNLITFSGDEHILFGQPVPATPANVAKAKKFLQEREGGGGTEMMKAIRAAMDPSDAQNHVRIVCFATDGQVGNDEEIIAEVRKHQNARVFTMGFGSVNRYLLDRMSQYGRGEVDYIANGDNGERAAKRFYERVRDPLLTDITVDWGGLPVTDVYPQRIADLFRSQPVILSGRFTGDAKGVVRLKGKMSGVEVVREIPVDFSAANEEHDVLATLWARKKIAELTGYSGAEVKQLGMKPEEVNEAVTNLGLDYRLMTEFTSFVAVDEKTVTPPGDPVRVDVPLESPGGITEMVTVASSGSTLDTTSNTSGTNVSTERFSNFPTQRTVQSLYSVAPTVSRSGLRDASGRDRDPSVAGSSGPENNYVLDGVNTTDPAFGGSGANLPFGFVQEVEIKTGAFGAEYGKSTGGVFNVVTKSGGNEFRGDVFGYFTTKGMIRAANQFPFTGPAPDGFSELDAGFDIGGPIKKDKLWFFGAFNPQRRTNYFLTQTFHTPVENKLSTPLYSGKLDWAINDSHMFTFSTFGDFTRQEGFLFGGSGFGSDPAAFRGTAETGGHNYRGRLNSTFTPNLVGEFAFGLHLQRANTIPESSTTVPLIMDSFAVLRNGAVLNSTHSPVVVSAETGTGDFINGDGGSVQRDFLRGPGFGLFSTQDRNRWEASARFQYIRGSHSFKYGFEFGRNTYRIDTNSTGNPLTYSGISTLGQRITNNFGVCVIQGTNIACPASELTARVQALLTAGVNLGGPTTTSTNTDPAFVNSIGATTHPFLIRTSTRVRDFRLIAPSTHTNVESFYVQDDFKLTKNITLNGGLRWDYQQAYGAERKYLSLNSFTDNLQPRLGIIWDFTGEGRGKLYLNYARYLEMIPLDLNVRAGSDTTQTDLNFNVDTLNAPAGSTVVADFGNLGAGRTPIDPGLKPQTLNEFRGGFEYEVVNDLTLGVAGIYRAQGSVIEDGSFNDGQTYFLFNPGESVTNDISCTPPIFDAGGNQIGGGAGRCFGPARRYYRALEFTATKRFTNNFQFIASYVYSSLIGNYEGLFRNDNGQADPNNTSLFDLVSLLNNTYGRLPNDRPHQFKFDGNYRLPFKLLVGASVRAQSGIPFNQLTPHAVYGDNEGFGLPRGTAIVPLVSAQELGFPNTVRRIGSNRTPTTYNLDLNAYYPIKFKEGRELSFQIDWLNVFNNQRAVRLDETFQINSGISGIPVNDPSNKLPNPFYGAGTIFQYPSSLKLGVKFSF
jgi:Ca-activated chloride channel family protein